MELTTWEQGAEKAADLIGAYYVPHTAIRLETTVELIDELVVRLVDNLFGERMVLTNAPRAWHNLFALLGARGVCGVLATSTDETFGETLKRVAVLVASKQHSYGHGNIDRFGVDGIIVRLSDKVERLKNLMGRNETPTIAESLADTWDDIVGYCIIALMVLQGTFSLPLAADVAA